MIWNVDPVIIDFGIVQLRYYGICWMLGLFLGLSCSFFFPHPIQFPSPQTGFRENLDYREEMDHRRDQSRKLTFVSGMGEYTRIRFRRLSQMKNLTTLQKNSHIPEPSKYFDCNGNMPITSEERIEMIENLENKFIEIFDILRVDRNDPNSTDSPRRMAKMWVKELFKGRFEPPPELTVV